MLSIHPLTPDTLKPWQYAEGFQTVRLSHVDFISKLICKSVWSGIVWKDGKRKQESFLSSDWCVLDFDDPDFTLSQAQDAFCDMIHIIGTTKSHQKEKNGIVCDRFRVVIKWDITIDQLAVYRHNMSLMAKKFPLDEKALDGARYFYPCTEIVQKSPEGFSEEVHPPPPAEDPELEARRRAFKRSHFESFGRLPKWIDAFFNSGKLITAGGRNNTVYAAALELFTLGFEYDDVFARMAKAPIDWNGYTLEEMTASVRSAQRRAQSMQGIAK